MDNALGRHKPAFMAARSTTTGTHQACQTFEPVSNPRMSPIKVAGHER